MDYTKLAAELFAALGFPPRYKGNQKVNVKSNDITLFYICKKGQLVPKDLSTFLDISSARVAKVLNELEDEGLITRTIDPEDRRRVIVSPTTEGKTKASNTEVLFINKMSFILEKIGNEDAREFVRITKRINQIMREQRPPCGEEGENYA